MSGNYFAKLDTQAINYLTAAVNEFSGKCGHFAVKPASAKMTLPRCAGLVAVTDMEGLRKYFPGARLYQIFAQDRSGRLDWVQPACILGLAIVGVFFIYSAQLHSGEMQWKKQLFFIGLGLGTYLIVSLINYKIFLENAHFIYIASILLLLLLWTPLGMERFGARRWLDFQVLAFQPSEAAKIGVLVAVASLLARHKLGTVRDSLTVLAGVFFIVLLPILLIFLQPDLGSSLVFPPMVFSLLFVSRLSLRFFAAALVAFVLAVGVLATDVYSYYNYFKKNDLSFSDTSHWGEYQEHSIVPLKDYQRNRILAFVAPEAIDPQGIGVSWNLRQSLIAVGSGGLMGKGWTEGTQAKLGYLPQSVAHNDFILSVIAEEIGFLGCLFILGLYLTLLANGIRIAGMARDRFGMLLAVGVSVIFSIHIFINIGMTIGLTPITGLPLPFVSYGGSFILICFALQGLIQSVYRFRRDFS